MNKEVKEFKKEEILEKAAKIFSQQFYKKVTMQSIADQIGMAKSNLYIYFNSKDDLYIQTVNFELNKWKDHIRKKADEKQDIRERLITVSREAFAYISGNEIIRGLLDFDQSFFVLSICDSRFKKVNVDVSNILKEILLDGVREGVFIDMNVGVVTEYLYSVYIMLLVKDYANHDEEKCRQFLTILIRGLSK